MLHVMAGDLILYSKKGVSSEKIVLGQGRRRCIGDKSFIIPRDSKLDLISFL